MMFGMSDPLLQSFTLDYFQTSTNLYIPEDCNPGLRNMLRIPDTRRKKK